MVECAIDDFRGHVLQGTEKGGDAFFEVCLYQNFRQPVVSKFDMSLLGKQDIFGFELSIDNTMLVQEANRHNNLSHDVSDEGFREKDVWLFGVEVEIAFGQILHDDVDVILVLEDLEDVCQERVPADGRDQLALQQVHLVYLGLGNYLHRESPPARFLLRQHHEPVRPFSQASHALVVFWPSCFGLLLQCLDI